MLFESLLDASQMRRQLRTEVDNLLARKRAGEELAEAPRQPAIPLHQHRTREAHSGGRALCGGRAKPRAYRSVGDVLSECAARPLR
jgi:hypothetical protein